MHDYFGAEVSESGGVSGEGERVAESSLEQILSAGGLFVFTVRHRNGFFSNGSGTCPKIDGYCS